MQEAETVVSLTKTPVDLTVKLVPFTATVRVWLSRLSSRMRIERRRAWSSWATA